MYHPGLRSTADYRTDITTYISSSLPPSDDNAGVEILHRGENGSPSERGLHLRSPPEPSRQPSLLWLQAFAEGMKMVFHSRTAFREEQGRRKEGTETFQKSFDLADPKFVGRFFLS